MLTENETISIRLALTVELIKAATAVCTSPNCSTIEVAAAQFLTDQFNSTATIFTNPSQGRHSQAMTMTSAANRMATPDELRTFKIDFECAKNHRDLALDHVRDAAEVEERQKRMRRTRAAAVELGRALLRMQLNPYAGRDLYGSWKGAMKALSIPESSSYWLMKIAKETDAPEHLTLTTEPNDNNVHVPDPEPMPVSPNRPGSAPLPPNVNDRPTPSTQRQKPATPIWTRPLVWLTEHVAPVSAWFKGRQLPPAKAKEAQEHIDALIELAKQAEPQQKVA